MEKIQAIATAYATARNTLDSASHSRLTKALDLALDGQTWRVEGTNWQAKGSGDAQYKITREDGKWACECPDQEHRAPEGLCKHILACMLICKAEKAMSQPAPAANAATPVAHEYPISISAKGTVHGIPNTMVTLRGHTMEEIEANAERVRAGSTCLLTVFDGSDRKPFVPDAAKHLYE